MANPRKFSEKIALHTQKQAEETAAFEQIMREVSDATSKVPKQHLLINQSLGSYRGGSLPNVNHIGSNSVDLKSALSNLEEMKAGRSDSPMVYRERVVRSVGVGPMRSRPNEKRIDTSPYSSGAYLSPPPDTSWRRTNSDSALHQSAMNIGGETSLHSSGSQRRVTDGQLLGIGLGDTDPSRKQLNLSSDGRPKSCCEVPRVPGINIYPSQQEPGTLQIPIGNNTGSLPDLTSFHFPPPLPTPLDQEDPSSSSYSTSPQAVSPSTLSPTSLSSRQMGRFTFGGSPQESQGSSPGHSPSTRRRQYPQHLQNLVIGGPQSPTQLTQTANHLSVPSLMNSRYLHTCKGVTLDNSGIDNFPQNQYVYQQPTHQHQQQPQPPPQSLQQQQQQQMQSHRTSPQCVQQTQQQQSPTTTTTTQHQQQTQQQQQQQQQCSQSLISNSQNMQTHHLNSLSTYRSPQPLSRPSPQTSPGLIVQGSLVYRSGSPGETSHSCPQSPVSPASSPGIGPSTSPFSDQNNYFISQAQANALQQHFEQFSMMDNPVSTSINYIGSQSNATHYSQAVSHGSPEDGLTQIGTQELSTDQGFYSQSPSQLQYNRPVSINPSGSSTQQTTPQTPNTPSSIPDIILTGILADFSSSTGDDLSRQEFVKDLGSAMSGSFDTDLLPSDEMLREGLVPIDFDGLQMLTDPEMNVITDPATEDNFRLDKL
ncbi:CREB-regulated transcription coactivator 1-like isoform X3 [Zootermopsis nevadensis]|uniref:CREB-regulated transcription coactivator 1-like isoform X3 n=1 Tax=Zootermopsis nevadensis TaxID=136037 RepID=UPI000B8E8B6C|nr:CREB-regulated transcription coactivator 1-like isoform X3 [Zootermopsis nevadensis]